MSGPIYVKTKSGVIHKLDPEGRSHEADNLDDADTIVISEDDALREIADDSAAACERCWEDAEP